MAIRRILKESDSDSEIRLSKGVRNPPTLATLEVEDPGAAKAEDAAEVVAQRKRSFPPTVGLELTSFDFDDPNKEVIPLVNELVYDVFSEVVEANSAVYRFFILATDCSTDGDGRRGLIDLVKGCIPSGVHISHQEEHSALRYPAREDPRPVLAKEHKLVRENRADDWRSTEASRRRQLYDRLDPDFYRAVRDRYPLPSDLHADKGRRPCARVATG
ncbi:hypothetical protein CYMTET_55313 [Cymbomonas tetramitiformis]|uniref:Uncharacterized protein n=1 Tax=Cymbomonas tetramitiformis TaxID=36881 RepID=A0AAE0EPV3_9CHLO|nr:hypothetical protein CYMTET_55313 [Cymbomonas tetramitiformis]